MSLKPWVEGRKGHALFLVFILIVAFYLRTYHVDWAEGQLPHPDERSTVAFYAPTIHWPKNVEDLLDPHRSTLNPLWDINAGKPRSYTYGHFPLYLLVLTANALARLAPVARTLGAEQEMIARIATLNGVPGFALVGRVLMAISDTFTVLLIYLIARRLYGRRWGLLAVAFSAFTVTQIQLAHYFAVDPMSTTFTMLAIYGAMRMVDEGTARAAVITGVGVALAVASKFSALPILAAPAIAVFVRWRRAASEGGPRATDRALVQGVHLFLLSFLVAAVVFAVTSPFVILDWPGFRKAVIQEQGAMVRGDADWPFTRQYRGTTPYLYHIEQSVRWGMGWALGLVGWIGLGWAFGRALRNRLQPGEWMLVAWVLLYFGPTGLFLAKFMRYTLPIVPTLIIFGTGLLAQISSTHNAQYLIPNTQYSPSTSHRPALHIQGIKIWGMSRLGVVRRPLALLVAAVTLAWSILWSLAFVWGVYGHTHTWITASRWIYANVPDGSSIAWEHWDDQLPLGLPEPNSHPGRYRYVMMPMYDEDTAEKFELIKKNLRQADYYVFASARLYRAIPHLPQRYPMTVRFYALFLGEQLGFRRVLDVTSYPRLGPLVFPDDEADESFWVYDHPRVLIYKKVRDLTDEEWDALLGGTWEGARHWDVGPPTLLSRIFTRLGLGEGAPAPPPPEEAVEKTLLLDRPFEELPTVRWWRWNRLASNSTPLAILTWWLVLLVIGVIAWPVAFLTFAHLRDRGYAFSKGLGLLFVAYLAWIVPSLRLWTNDLPLVLTVLLAVALVNGWLARRYWGELSAFVLAHRSLLLFYEALFTLAFLFFVFIRLLNPDLWQPWNGGEKFMEIAFLNATVRSPYFPPYDPYFAGGTVNYYYWGYQVVNVLIKFTGITPTVAFNLAVPTLFALTVVASCGLVYNLASWIPGQPRARRPWWQGLEAGLVGSAFVALLGNVDAAAQIVRQLAGVSDAQFRSSLPLLETGVRALKGLWRVLTDTVTLPRYDYWAPSRVIPYTINEFPYWSFLFADLHPHMMGIPFTIIFLGMALNTLAGYGTSWFWADPLAGLVQFLALPLGLGALAAINTWDLPTYLGIIAVVLALRQWRGERRLNLAVLVPQVGVVTLGVYLLFRPFFAHYAPIAASGVGWEPQKTPLGKWLNMWAFWFFLAVTFLAAEVTRRDGLGPARWLRALVVHFQRLPDFLRRYRCLVQDPDPLYDLGRWVLDLSPLLAVGLWLLGYRVPALLVVPVVVAAMLTLRRQVSPGLTFAALMTFTGLLVLLGVEFVYLKDHLQGGEFRRMNTLFKFYIQAWVLLALAGAVALPGIVARLPRWSLPVRAAWQGTFAVLLGASLVFLLVGTPARVKDRFPEELSGRPRFGTLDGMAYMSVGVYTWPDPSHRIDLKWDYQAIRWLLDNVSEVVPIAEARLDYYREGGTRVASFTGLPTFMGLHQSGEQRYGWQTGPREKLAREFWMTTDIARTMEIIREVGIRYIYVSRLERQLYPAEALAKFDRMVGQGLLEVVYENEGVRIYRVRG